MKKRGRFWAAIVFFAVLEVMVVYAVCDGSSGSGAPPADSIFFNARIYTADSAQSEAEALVAADGKIIFIGSDEEALTYALAPGGTSRDLGGRRVLPGMIDTHCHLITLSGGNLPEKLPEIDSSMSKAEVVAAVRAFAEANPDVPAIIGLGFYAPTCRPVHKSELDAAVPDRPVFLLDSGGHFGWANTAALDRVDTTDDSGTHYFERDEDGNLTGGMYEQGPVFRMMATLFPLDDRLMADAMSEAIAVFNSFGITGIFDAGAIPQQEPAVHDVLRGMEAKGALNMRFFTSHFAMPFDDETTIGERLAALGAKTDLVRPNALKMIQDGTIEACSAYMFEPYNPPGEGVGAASFTLDQMAANGKIAAAKGFGVHIHAIGDRAISETLEAFERMGPAPTKTMAHCQVLPADGLARWAKQTDVVFQTTPVWLIPAPGNSTGKEEDDFTYKVLGRERFLRQCPFQSLKEIGAVITFGSDFPVSGGLEGVDPLNNIWVAVNRKTLGGDKIFSPTSGYLDMKDAIDAYTINAARQLDAEGDIGSLEAGKRADFVVLDRDILAIDPNDVHGVMPELGFTSCVSVLETYLGGEAVYKKE